MSTTTTFTVTGMTCGHCVAAVTEEVRKVNGVRDVDIELETGRVTIESEVGVDPGAIRAAVEEAGYQVAQ